MKLHMPFLHIKLALSFALLLPLTAVQLRHI